MRGKRKKKRNIHYKNINQLSYIWKICENKKMSSADSFYRFHHYTVLDLTMALFNLYFAIVMTLG